MALPTSGQLGIGDIMTELGTSSGSLRNLSDLAGFSTPDNISDFYGYSAVTAVDLIGSVNFTLTGSYTWNWDFIIDFASGDFDGEALINISITYIATNYYYSQNITYTDNYGIRVGPFFQSGSTFAPSVEGGIGIPNRGDSRGRYTRVTSISNVSWNYFQSNPGLTITSIGY